MLNKKLILDIASIRKLPTITIYIDATNCYNRVVHLFTSLCTQYFSLDITYLLVLFKIIQIMKIYLRISFRILDTCYMGEDKQLFQGAMQGNRVAPVL